MQFKNTDVYKYLFGERVIFLQKNVYYVLGLFSVGWTRRGEGTRRSIGSDQKNMIRVLQELGLRFIFASYALTRRGFSELVSGEGSFSR